MEKIVITTNTLSNVVVGSTVDTLVAVTHGAGVLCLGPDSPVGNCLPVSAGYQIVARAGLVVKAAKTGDSITFVTGPMGV